MVEPSEAEGKCRRHAVNAAVSKTVNGFTPVRGFEPSRRRARWSVATAIPPAVRQDRPPRGGLALIDAVTIEVLRRGGRVVECGGLENR